MSEHEDGQRGAEQVGSLGEEAARLLGSLAGWAREHAPDPGEGPVDGTADVAAAGWQDVAEQVADAWRHSDAQSGAGPAECAVCPVCRTVHALRGLSPEVRSHLASAATHLLQAGLAVLAHAPGPSAEDPAGRARPGVEHIDLAEEWPEDREQG